MICVTVVQESRRLAMADMLNAAMLGADLIEVRLDKFEKDANLAELVSARRKPVLFSCRRPQDGGEWAGTEEERLILLRSAVMAKADYVELEVDAADQVRPFPGYKRVISYTNLEEVPRDIDAIVQEMMGKKPDVLKITCPANSIEEAWPLLPVLNKATVPMVVVGRGPAASALALIGRKVGAPWVAAALEKGLEAYPGQPTVRDLTELYRYREIDKKTRFVGVLEDGERSRLATALLNAAFVHLGWPHRVLPLLIRQRKNLRKLADALRLQGVLAGQADFESMHEAAVLDDSARLPVQAADGMVPVEQGWSGFNALGSAVATALEAALRERDPEAKLQGRVVLFAGCGPLSRMMAGPFKSRGASFIWASKSREAAQTASQLFSGRQLLWEALYNTSHDVLVIARDGASPAETTIHPGYLKPSMAVVDLTAGVRPSPFLEQAADRGCVVVKPTAILIEQLREHLRRMGGDVPPTVFDEPLAAWLPEG